MAGPGGAARSTKKGGGSLGWLLAGVVLGVLGTIFLPRLAGPYMPAMLRGTSEQLAGVVDAKAADTEELLLTVGSQAGATLITYTKNIQRVNQLVGVGDSIVLAIGEYAPFLRNSDIRRVVKSTDWTPAAPSAGATTGEASPAADTTAVDPAAIQDTAAADPEAVSDTAADSAMIESAIEAADSAAAAPVP